MFSSKLVSISAAESASLGSGESMGSSLTKVWGAALIPCFGLRATGSGPLLDRFLADDIGEERSEAKRGKSEEMK
jgi:hypothetical protein